MKTAILLIAVALAGCSAKTASTNAAGEFVADIHSFDNFTSWTQPVPPRRGADPAGLIGTAHGSKDTTLTRVVYVNPSTAERAANKHFPNGTIFVKDLLKNGLSTIVTAMVKRGGSFSPAGNGWEYFIIKNGAIVSRGDTVMSGKCMGCHASAGEGRDYIFVR